MITSNAVYNSLIYRQRITNVTFSSNPAIITIDYTGITGNLTENMCIFVVGSGYITYLYYLSFGLDFSINNVKWQSQDTVGSNNRLGNITNVTYDSGNKKVKITLAGTESIYGVTIFKR